MTVIEREREIIEYTTSDESTENYECTTQTHRCISKCSVWSACIALALHELVIWFLRKLLDSLSRQHRPHRPTDGKMNSEEMGKWQSVQIMEQLGMRKLIAHRTSHVSYEAQQQCLSIQNVSTRHHHPQYVRLTMYERVLEIQWKWKLSISTWVTIKYRSLSLLHILM